MAGKLGILLHQAGILCHCLPQCLLLMKEYTLLFPPLQYLQLELSNQRLQGCSRNLAFCLLVILAVPGVWQSFFGRQLFLHIFLRLANQVHGPLQEFGHLPHKIYIAAMLATSCIAANNGNSQYPKIPAQTQLSSFSDPTQQIANGM
jgi:hypothetical protein